MTRFILTLTIVLICSGIGATQTGKNATAQEKKDLFQLILTDKSVSEFLADFEGGDNQIAVIFISKKFPGLLAVRFPYQP